MKKLLYVILFFLCSQNITLFAVQDEKFKLSTYQLYFIIKEFTRLHLYEFFGYITHEKLESSQVYCMQCHEKITASLVWAYLTVTANETLLENLIDVVLHKTQEELDQFLLECCKKCSMPCYSCAGHYQGWSSSHETNC
jgi:hypothetical protein